MLLGLETVSATGHELSSIKGEIFRTVEECSQNKADFKSHQVLNFGWNYSMPKD